MLKDIRIHLNADEEKQSKLEAKSAERAIRNYRRNQAAFRAFVPSLVNEIKESKSRNISIFTNRNGEFNIVDYSNGHTLYDLDPESECLTQYAEKSLHCTYCSLEEDVVLSSDKNDINALYTRYLSQPSLVNDINVIVVMGIGLGFHIQTLIEQHNIKHLVIYEPEEQYFLASLYALDWKAVLETAKNKGTSLYFQLKNDGTSLMNDIEELKTHFPLEGFFFYRHYNYITFNVLENALLTSNWVKLNKDGISRQLRDSQEDILPRWNKPIPMTGLSLAQGEGVFTRNIDVFKRYVPNIAKEFANYKPSYWFPVQNHEGAVNVLSRVSLSNWYSDSPFQDAKINFENFKEYPNKDGLVLGYNGVKLKQPQEIKSLILFGIGPQLETLFDNNEVEKLFICEPNRDLFNASLYLIDWAGILRRIDETGGRLYINVGDDGSNLFKDLLNQFYAVGPYILANTYFYQTYNNVTMEHTISQLREQLQVVIAMGENFDHARYGIAHTKETICRKYPLLISKPANKLSLADKDVPIFIVGNGPSLDSAIDNIKLLKERAIVVSCGTALMPLYKNGIVPDFHAEIEQNRSTFDWSCRIDDFDYLKKVDLLSCNGIHPDTCELFRNTYIAFKEGESSTVSSLNLLGQKNYEELQFAYPTVSNFAINLFTLLGFQQLYLFGIDLGFVQQDKHHSKQSGYYDKQGNEKYSYKERHNTNIVVPGNFRQTVFTKYEFKVSKAIIERTLAKKQIDCFNTSDGALILGTKPLKVDDILLVSTVTDKVKALEKIKTQAFQSLPEGYNFLTKYDEFYLQPTLEAESESDKVHRLNMLREVWLDTLKAIQGAVSQKCKTFDHVSTFVPEREAVFIKEQSQNFIVRSMLEDSENQYLEKYVNAVSKIEKKRFETDSDKSEIALLCGTKEYDIVENFRAKNIIVQIDEATSSKDLENHLNNQDTILFHHPVFDFKRDVDAYLNGETVFYHSIIKASWAVKAWIQKSMALVIIPKVYFVGESKEISGSLQRYTEKILSIFPDDLQYIDYPNYIMVPKKNTQYNDYIVDKLGNRGVVCIGKPQVSSMFFEGVSKREALQQIKNNILWWGFESE